ncbi:MAG: hypothetical protein OEM82_00490 [Acidobacteriota bacterium]|nr:hypothetical protein [Acidobacteriota bacterium]MDH3530821.1 hypothetical protein [Acidobacteriota bacterium]
MGTKTKTRNGEIPTLHGRAMDNLEFIRDAMQRSSAFTAVPGYGGALMGVTAIGAAVIAGPGHSPVWVATWTVEAALAFLIGLFAMWQKAQSSEDSLKSKPARKFALGFAPPLLVGVILTAMLAFNGHFLYLPAVWLLLYGTSVVTGGAYSVKVVPVMGWLFIVLGAVAAFVPLYGNWLMALGFGVLHVVFGLIIGRSYGG